MRHRYIAPVLLIASVARLASTPAMAKGFIMTTIVTTTNPQCATHIHTKRWRRIPPPPALLLLLSYTMGQLNHSYSTVPIFTIYASFFWPVPVIPTVHLLLFLAGSPAARFRCSWRLGLIWPHVWLSDLYVCPIRLFWFFYSWRLPESLYRVATGIFWALGCFSLVPFYISPFFPVPTQCTLVNVPFVTRIIPILFTSFFFFLYIREDKQIDRMADARRRFFCRFLFHNPFTGFSPETG